MLTLVYLAAIFIPIGIFSLIVGAVQRKRKRFVNPLTKNLRRSPGAALGRQLGDEQFELGLGALELFVPGYVPVLGYANLQTQPESRITLVFFIVSVVVWVLWTGYALLKTARRVRRIQNLRLGYECELAVGQELDLLMLNGSQVFHDLPAEGFNIDHVVVSQAGVFAVETKGRSKTFSDDKQGKKQFRVEYRSGVLHFPKGPDREAVPQAARQAKWLSQWLSSAVGEPVPVRPVVVLPGWYVEITDSPEVPVIASGYIQGYFRGQKAAQFSLKQIQRIAHQLDQKVRDLAPGEIAKPAPA